MTATDSHSYYDVLDLRPDATQQDIRSAYLRCKATYGKDNLALYSLVGSNEREEMIGRIEEAYEVLSHPEKRRSYDQHHGLLSPEEAADRTDGEFFSESLAEVVSIDRVPPMENSDEQTLVSPPTSFSAPSEASTPKSPPPPPQPREIEAPWKQEIAQEVEWRGSFLRKIREAQHVSLEELSGITKITKSYLIAIEEENYPKLPVPVYLRGFITQMAKALKLPAEKVATAYMARYYQMQSDRK